MSISVFRAGSRKPHLAAGFTLLEVLVALVIVGTALGASLRAIGSLAKNGSGLRVTMMATWSAENQLTQIRLAHIWPPLGDAIFSCPQDGWQLRCEQHVLATPNPYFRRVEVQVFDTADPQRQIVKLTQVVSNGA